MHWTSYGRSLEDIFYMGSRSKRSLTTSKPLKQDSGCGEITNQIYLLFIWCYVNQVLMLCAFVTLTTIYNLHNLDTIQCKNQGIYCLDFSAGGA